MCYVIAYAFRSVAMKCIASDDVLKNMRDSAMEFGSTVQYFCPYGKVIDGGDTNRNITCSLGRDGTAVVWDPQVPTCTGTVWWIDMLVSNLDVVHAL